MKKAWRLILLLAVLVGALGSPFAARSPDGLERVTLDYGLEDREAEAILPAPFPDYQQPWVANEYVSTALSGFIGVVVIFLSGAGVGRLLMKKDVPVSSVRGTRA